MGDKYVDDFGNTPRKRRRLLKRGKCLKHRRRKCSTKHAHLR